MYFNYIEIGSVVRINFDEEIPAVNSTKNVEMSTNLWFGPVLSEWRSLVCWKSYISIEFF